MEAARSSWLDELSDRLSRLGVSRSLAVLSGALAVGLTLALGHVAVAVGILVGGVSVAALSRRGQQLFEVSPPLGQFSRQSGGPEHPPIVTDGAGPGDPTSAISPRTDTDRTDPPEDTDADETARRLLTAGVVEPCAQADDLCLAAAFHEQWWRRIGQCRDTETAKQRLAAVIDADPRVLSFDTRDRSGPGAAFVVSHEGDTIAQWPSRGAFLADLAAEPTLAEWIGDWAELPDRTRTELLVRLRALLDTCPACDRSLRQNVETVSTCCGGNLRRVSVECPACGSVFNATSR